MSEDPDPPDMARDNVARLHPPGLPHQASLDRAVQAQIGAQLRTMYEHYVEQAIPERLIDLVHRLGEPRGPAAGGQAARDPAGAREHGTALGSANAPGTAARETGPAGGRRPAGPQADPRSAGEEA